MKKIHIHSLPLKDVIQDFAKTFKVNYSQNCEEYKIELPKTWGSGSIKGINFEGGIGIIQYNCVFNQDVELHFSVNEVHPLKFLYCIEGTLKHNFQNEKEVHLLKQYQNSIVASKDYDGHVLLFEKDTQTSICSLEIDRKAFKSEMHCEIDKSGKPLQLIFNDETAKSTFFYEGYFCLRVADYIQEIKDFKLDGLINKLFLKGKAFQILTRQIIQYQDDNNGNAKKKIIRKSELKALLEAIAIIEKELEHLGTVQSIAKRVGLNGNKLQDGFKFIHNNTVNGFIQKTRLDLAKSLLINTNIPIVEIMQTVGLTSQSYFSKLFKEAYNVTPSYFRTNNTKHFSKVKTKK